MSTRLEIPRGCCFIDGESDENAKAIPVCGCNKLNSHDWLSDIDTLNRSDIYEIRFKNTRKGYYQNSSELVLKVGDIVAVEAAPGHDIGIISASNDMVEKQMRKSGFRSNGIEFKKIYRKARPSDIAKWQRAIAQEHQTMIASRQIAASLELNMKIGDVEYQGDGAKAIFYYIADERVDFRELIKIFAEQFRIRIEMKQIGARQEAGRIGGIGSCGRELCCSKWIANFVSVTTSSARFQEISLNPLKLAGQCSKLKCCLNYEVDSYIDHKRRLPKIAQPLETIDAQYHLIKTDILRGLMLFSSDPSSMANVITLTVDRVREIIKLNRKGIKVDRLQAEDISTKAEEPSFMNVVGEESITRFDNNRRSNKGRNNRRGGGNRQDGGRPQRGGDRNNNRQEGGKPNSERDQNAKGANNRSGNRPNNNRRQNNNRQDGENRVEEAKQQVSKQPQERNEGSNNRQNDNRGGGNNRRRNFNRNKGGNNKPKTE